METTGRGWDAARRLSRNTSGGNWGMIENTASPSRRNAEEDEQQLRWAALEKLPTFDRLKTSMMSYRVENDEETSTLVQKEVDVTELDRDKRAEFIDRIFKVAEEDNDKFLRKLRDRIDRVGIQLPSVEVRFENLTVEADCYVGNRALPTLINSSRNVAEMVFGWIGIKLAEKKKLTILKNASGILKPSRMVLLLGPPSSGKTTLLLALAAKLDPSLKVQGEITYNGHKLNEFVPQRTSVYISQNDIHIPELTVKETLDFSAKCQGVGSRYDLLTELIRREKAAGIYNHEAEVDLFMKATAVGGSKNNLQTDYILKILGLDICKDTIVGDQMMRGISGGQKKRVTTGEMIVGPTKTLFMDEISTGLDSSTTYQIVKCLRQIVHFTDNTILMSLLQPAPETFDLFDDIILLSEGQIVYQGPRENVLEFFESCGFCCPERKGVADFLQEVTSKKDQEQYWADKRKPYRYVSASEFAYQFKTSRVGLELYKNMLIPYDKSKSHKAALVFTKYGASNKDLFKASFEKEWLLIKRNSFTYIFKTVQIVVVALIGSTLFLRTTMHEQNEEDASIYLGALAFTLFTHMFNGSAEMHITLCRLPVFYKQRDLLFHPTWTFTLANFLLRVPISIIEAIVWIMVSYYAIGFTPEASRFFKQFFLTILIQQSAAGLFKLSSAICRTQTVSGTLGNLILLFIFLFSGFIIPRDKIPAWLSWGYWCSPMAYAYNAISVNEMLAPRWMNKMDSNNSTRLGISVLKNVAVFPESSWFWIGAGALFGFTIIYNILSTLSLMYLDPLGKPQAVLPEETDEDIQQHEDPKNKISRPNIGTLYSIDRNNATDVEIQTMYSESNVSSKNRIAPNKGLVLPFIPLSLSFNNVNYYVDMPSEMKAQKVSEDRLQLLSDVSGAFRPGILTALMGVSGAGKTTLMDVLAGRKTGGYIEGDIRISGYSKNQSTFARVSGYCEQFDIHSPQVTVRESVIYSAFLRLPREVKDDEKMAFVDEVMELVELDTLKDALVGIPGVTGLSTEQRKRLTIAVELVANPSIIFMDEPTSGLDARAAAIVMRTVRNTVNTGRTIVCTIHQPSIDIFEAFDELLLMKRGGQVIYMGPLGYNSQKIIDYFEKIPGVPRIKDKYNPATWMLEVTSIGAEVRLGIDFATHYKFSALHQRNKQLIKELSTPAEGATDLFFPAQYSQPMWGQFRSCFWKQWLTYWRSPHYNLVRFFFTLTACLMIGAVFWNIGHKRDTSTELHSVMGAMNTAVLFIGVNNCANVQPIVFVERSVFYRERAAGMYSALPYAIAQVVTEIPYVFMQTTFYIVIMYAMMGFEWIAAKFFWFFFISFITFLYFTYYGMMTVSITPSLEVGSMLATSFYSIFNLFSGFFIPRPRIPIWWRWYYWICPVAWTVRGLITSQYGDMEDVIQVPGIGDQQIKIYITDTFGYDPDSMGEVAGVLISFAVFFALLFAFAISKFNFQQR